MQHHAEQLKQVEELDLVYCALSRQSLFQLQPPCQLSTLEVKIDHLDGISNISEADLREFKKIHPDCTIILREYNPNKKIKF